MKIHLYKGKYATFVNLTSGLHTRLIEEVPWSPRELQNVPT